MADNNLITQITNIIIEQTVKQKIPTVVFLSDIEKWVLVKNLFWALKSGNKDERSFSQEDWNQVAKIMRNLAEIPLLLKETFDINEIKTETENFIKEINKGKGAVIINNNELASNLECKNQPNIFTPDFTTGENISIIIL